MERFRKLIIKMCVKLLRKTHTSVMIGCNVDGNVKVTNNNTYVCDSKVAGILFDSKGIQHNHIRPKWIINS